MKYRLMDILACPWCKSKLELTVSSLEPREYPASLNGRGTCKESCYRYKEPPRSVRQEACNACYREEVVAGHLTCQTCASRYPISSGIPRMLIAGTETGDRSRFDWDKFNYYQDTFGGLDKREPATFMRLLLAPQLPADYLDYKLILEAGCGEGQFLVGLAQCHNESIGIDLGPCVERAAQSARDQPFVHLVQGDLMHAPFEPRAFDIVFSVGVIHYLPSAENAFKRLAELAGPGGRVTVWVYPRRRALFEAIQRALRSVTTRLPSRLLFYLCFLAVPLLFVVSTNSGGTPRNRGWRACAYLLHAYYAPRYLSSHSAQEVESWFRKNGFGDLASLPVPVTFTGRSGRPEGYSGPC